MEKSLKTIWKEKSGQVWQFYCPLCRVPRRLPGPPRPTSRHMIQIGLTSLVFMLATWSWFEWKGVVVFVPLWITFEVLYRVRVRRAAHCESCGFDPFLFMVDHGRARTEVENYWRNKLAEKGIPYPEKKPRPAPADTQNAP